MAHFHRKAMNMTEVQTFLAHFINSTAHHHNIVNRGLCCNLITLSNDQDCQTISLPLSRAVLLGPPVQLLFLQPTPQPTLLPLGSGRKSCQLETFNWDYCYVIYYIEICFLKSKVEIKKSKTVIIICHVISSLLTNVFHDQTFLFHRMMTAKPQNLPAMGRPAGTTCAI